MWVAYIGPILPCVCDAPVVNGEHDGVARGVEGVPHHCESPPNARPAHMHVERAKGTSHTERISNALLTSKTIG